MFDCHLDRLIKFSDINDDHDGDSYSFTISVSMLSRFHTFLYFRVIPKSVHNAL